MGLCVDKNSPIFKKMCSDYSIDTARMELIIHSWWTTHKDGSMPDDTFINNNLYGESIEMSANDIKLAEARGFFGSKEFDSVDEATTYLKRLEALYPKKAIGSFIKNNGKMVISLAKPLNYKGYHEEEVSQESRIKLRSKNTWTELVKEQPALEALSEKEEQSVQDKLEEHIKEETTKAIHGSTYTEYFDTANENGFSFSTIGETLDNIIKNTKDADVKILAEFAKKYVNSRVSKFSITYSDKSDKTERGSYSASDNEITIHKNAVSGRNANEAKASFEKVMLHEIIHAITVNYISSDIEAKKEIASIMNQLDNAIKSGNKNLKVYALKNTAEFIAEFMSKPTLREALKLIPYQEVKTKKPKNMFQKIMEVIKNALSKLTGKSKQDKTLYDKAMESLTRIMEKSYDYQNAETFNNTKENTEILKKDTQKFLDNFGITIKDVSNYEGELPLFDALNRVINVRNAKDITDGVGEAVAFMMQYDPNMREMISVLKTGSKKALVSYNFSKPFRLEISNYLYKYKTDRSKYIRFLGEEIAKRLRDMYNLKEMKSEDKSIWSVIANFFNKLNPFEIYRNSMIAQMVEPISKKIKDNDASIIIQNYIKPGTTEKAEIVDIGKALIDNPYEDSIVRTLNKHGIALAGGASIAVAGTLYRPTENPLHDLDFNASGKTEEDINAILSDSFKSFEKTNHITNSKTQETLTYLVMDREFEQRRDIPGISIYTIYDKATGEKLGTRVGSNLTLKDGVKGKMLDFFIGEDTNKYSHKKFTLNNNEYLFADYREALNAKITWKREKDIWDYNRFVPYNTENEDNNSSVYRQETINELSSTTQSQEKINIYAGTNENAHLSNFANRPFTVDSSMTINIDGNHMTLFDSDTKFNSVEQAFQAAKIAFAYDGTENSIDDDTANSFDRRIKNATPAQARALGKQIPMSAKALERWNKHKEEVMKMLIKASFEQNPDALKQLTATGNATLTHIQDRGEWGTLFPKVLMEVREELRGQEDYLSEIVPIKNNLKKVDSLLSSLPKIDTRYFSNLDEAIEFIGTLSEYNPRLKQLSEFLKKTKQEGKSLTKIEQDAMMGLLREVSKKIESHIDTIESLHKGEITILQDKNNEPIKVGLQDWYFDISIKDENKRGIVVKDVSNGKVTFVRTEWTSSGEVEKSEKQTVSEEEFRRMTGEIGSDFRFSNLYGFADVYTTTLFTEEGTQLYSLEVNIPNSENRGKGYGLEIYEAVIEELAARGAYLTPGNVVPSNHVWEALERRGRVKEVTLSNGKTAIVALPKTQITKKENNKEEYGQRRIYSESLSTAIREGWKEISRSSKETPGEILQEQSNTQGENTSGSSRLLDDVVKEASESLDKKLSEKGIKATKQPIRLATSKEFHKAISEEKKKNPNGFMVDVHNQEDYDNDLCLLTEDGKAGIAITPDGDIISVFSSVPGDHRLEKLMFMAIAAGGKKLDCFYLDLDVTLPRLYARFGFKAAAVVPFDAEQYKPEGYDEWQRNNPDTIVLGVAAMYLEEVSPLDTYDVYRDPNIEGATVFTGESGYDNALKERDSILHNIETARQQAQEQTKQMKQAQESKELSEQDQKFIDDSVELTKGLTNLQTSSVLTSTEARKVADDMVNWISDKITELIENPESRKEYEKELANIDFSKAERIDIVRAIGSNRLIQDCKKAFNNSQKEGNVSLRKLRVINDNWKALMYLASSTFMANEQFSIVSMDGNETIKESDNLKDDNTNGNKSVDEIQEGTRSEQENWQIEARTKDILQKASALVRHALRQCYILDSNGNPEKSEFGVNKRVKIQKAVNSIVRWTQGAMDINEMAAALEAKAKDNPWINQIITKLRDTTGKEADFQSQFFTAFCQREQLYSVVTAVKQEGGKVTFVSKPVNRDPALKEAVNSVVNQYKIGQHPMFTSQGVNESALQQLAETNESLIKMGLSEEFNQERAAKLLTHALHSLGYYVAEADVMEAIKDKPEVVKDMVEALSYIVEDLTDNIDNNNYQPFTFKAEGSIYGNVKKMLKPVTEKLEDVAVSSFYSDGKMYQTYTTPSYMTNLLAKFHKTDDNAFMVFIMEQYGSSEWFKDKTGDNSTGWKVPWLDRLVNDPKARKIFDHKVQLSFNQQSYMTEMGDLQYTLSIMSEFFSAKVEGKALEVPTWFRVPMLSNKTSSEYIKFYRQVGSRYKDSIALGMTDMMFQELARIRTVNMRNLKEGDPGYIKNWDERGKEFTLLSFLNKYMKEDSRFGELLRKATSKEGLTDTERKELVKLGKQFIKEEMQKKADSILAQYKRDGIIDAASSIANIGNSEEEITENIENFIWNDTFAAMNILELTITDPAYYKDAVDLQKRFAQIHAPGTRPNINATDYGDGIEGSTKRVSDRYSRTIVLNDFKGVKSNIIENLEIVFDRKIKAAKNTAEKEMYRNMKENIIKQFKDINVTDAQAFNSPTSYRKKAILFGRWNPRKEAIYQKLMKGEYNFSDLQEAFGEVLKPFVYTQTVESVGKENSPIQNMLVPFQNKNAEYLLIMADAILRGEDTGQPNLLRAIYDVMEDSAKNNPTMGIDTVQFDSAIKSGLRDAISIHQFIDKPNGTKLAKEHLLNSIYETSLEDDGNGNKTLKRGNNYKSSVRLIDWMDYGIQQEVPSHFKEHYQAHGSQIRAIIPSELSATASFMVEGKPMNAKEFADEYERTIAENIEESINELANELNLRGTRKERNIALSKILRAELATSSRYGIDLVQACLVDENGEFNMPLGDPIQAKRIEQLLNSVVKNRINKQTIAGGPVVQVSNFGTSKKLNIRFKDKSGNLLMTRAEYEKSLSIEIPVFTKKKVRDLTTAEHTNLGLPIFGTDIAKVMDRVEIDENVPKSAKDPKYGIQNSSRIYLKGQRDRGYFELVKDVEDNNYSVHFKPTDKNNPNAFTKEEKQVLFQALAQIIPEGANVSTWGELSPGGIAGLNRFKKMGFTETGKRSVKRKGSYEDYIKENQAGVAYFECYAPIYANELFTKFAKPDGTIDIEAIEKLDPDLLKMVGYRIPTEDRYSCAPLKIVGFLPREAGDGIMLPYEITRLSGSDKVNV